ncbi:hypothetical protein [Lentzea sp. NPDC092896]|uniref:hypothetical protein n=1 Tax=Lentzea sp. NPDC092896 TaxID=3364127 RepID=UPI0037F7A994
MRSGQVIAAVVFALAVAGIVIPVLTLVDAERPPEQRPTVVRTDDMTWRSTPSSRPGQR